MAKRNRQRGTLASLAAELGVSRTTVSNAYNRPEQLSAALREKILATAEQRGYPGPHPTARSLRTRRAGAIGVLLTEHLTYAFEDLASVDFLAGMAEASYGGNTCLTLVPVGPDSSVDVAAAAQLGGRYSGADTEQLEHLRILGDTVGIAFQIADDLIDIASPTADSGKTPGTDLREGVHTLPVLYALEEDTPTGERLRTLLAEPLTDDAEVAEALELLRGSEGMRRARATLDGYVQTAMDELDRLPAGPANEALRRLVRFTVERAG